MKNSKSHTVNQLPHYFDEFRIIFDDGTIKMLTFITRHNQTFSAHLVIAAF